MKRGEKTKHRTKRNENKIDGNETCFLWVNRCTVRSSTKFWLAPEKLYPAFWNFYYSLLMCIPEHQSAIINHLPSIDLGNTFWRFCWIFFIRRGYLAVSQWISSQMACASALMNTDQLRLCHDHLNKKYRWMKVKSKMTSLLGVFTILIDINAKCLCMK